MKYWEVISRSQLFSCNDNNISESISNKPIINDFKIILF
jgi:hypothetical protein